MSDLKQSETSYNTKPTYGVVGVLPHQYTEYPYFVDFSIIKKSDLPGGKPFYHGALFSRSSSIPPDVVFSTMLKGYMGIFPGVNGQTRTVSTYVEK